MSLVTSCPSCSTRFKIVPDQLKISEGWVRCGHCAQVFDASERIEHLSTHLPPGSPPPILTETLNATTDSAQTHDFMDAIAPSSASAAPPSSPQASATLASAPLPSPALPSPTMELAVETPEPITPLSEAPETGSTTVLPSDWTASASESEIEQALKDQTDTAEDEVGFIRQARQRAFWARPWARAALILTALTLISMLTGQLVYTERDRLYAQHTMLREPLTHICSWLGCDIQAWRDTESIVIDGTKFTKLASDTGFEAYQLEVILKNKSSYPVAWPALELTLTDSQDRPLLRKVLLAQDLSKQTVLEETAEKRLELPIKVDTSVVPGRITGYRVLAFYP